MKINKLFPKIFRKTARTRVLFFMISDIIFVCLAVYLAFFLRFEGNIPNKFFPALQRTTVLALVFHLPILHFLGLYSFSWSYVSTRELISLIKATTSAFLLVTVAIFISSDFLSFIDFPRSTLAISFILTFLFLGAIRFSKRVYLQIFKKAGQEQKERTLIIGAGDAGEQILRSIQSSHQSPYFPVGFIDDSVLKQKSSIHGIKVLAGIEDVPEIVSNNQIEAVIVALPSVESLVIKRAVEMARKAGIKKIKILPSLSEIVDGQVSLASIRDFKLEDLLNRNPVSYDVSSIERFIQGKTVLITGAAGSIGSELSRQVMSFNPHLLLLLDQDETGIFNISKELKEEFSESKIISIIADIQDKNKINKVFTRFNPNVVFHAAAYKHVPLMEKHSDEAVKNNIFGTETVAKAALRQGTEKFIFISTDKAVNPISVMGISKRIGEMVCQVLNQRNITKFISVRFGNVLGSRGSVIPIFKEQIKKGGPIQVTHGEMKRYFMIIPEAVNLVLQAGEMGQGGEVFVLNMGSPVKILDLAKELIRLSGLEPDKDIPIVFTEPRPGEKFFEEILFAEEGIVATQNINIFMAKLSQVNEQMLWGNLLTLKNATENINRQEIVNVLKQIVAVNF